MTTNFHVIIPARFDSSRLPGKVLLAIDGKPMIQHVYERAAASSAKQVVVATDDQRVFDCVKEFDGEAVMTATTHESGTDRLQEAAAQLLLADNDIVVNVQGDEPLMPPAVIDQVAQNLAHDQDATVSTLCAPITEVEEFRDPNAVKVVMSEQERALYFSRAPIPWPRDTFLIDANADGSEEQHVQLDHCFRHIGIYAYRVGLLHRFVKWPVAPLEALEKLEQLRVLWHGEKIHVAPACAEVPAGVDSEADLQRVQQILIAANEKAR